MTRDELIALMAQAICVRSGAGPNLWRHYVNFADAALTAIEAAGMRVVPEEAALAIARAEGMGEAEAKLREAVEVMRELNRVGRLYLPYDKPNGECDKALETTRAFLATMEKPHE